MWFQRKNKSAPRDFAEDMLPADRKQMFFDCIRQRFDLLLKGGLILSAAALPLLIVRFWEDAALAGLSVGEDAQALAGTADALRQIVALVEIPCYMLLGVGLAAVSRILRQLIWAEPVFFFHHAALGLKQNAGRFAAVFLLYGVVRATDIFVATVFADSFLSLIPSAVTLLLFLPVGLYMLSQSVFYNVSFAKSFSNGLALYPKTAPFVWIFVVCLSAGVLTNLIPAPLIRLPVRILLTVFAVPVFSLAWMLYSCHVFDKFINPKQYPEIVGKGLYRPTDRSDP